MPAGKVGAYGVTPDREQALSATVTLQGAIHEATPTEVSIEGVSLGFPQEQAPTLPLGEPITVTFVASNLSEPLKVRGASMLRVEGPEFRSYRIEFYDSKEIEKRLPASFFQVFNRRVSYRVTPDPDEPVAVSVAPANGPESPAQGRLEDISAGGIGVQADRSVEATFAAIAAVRVSFSLPPGNEPIELLAEIRRRKLTGDSVSYGIQFDDTTLTGSPVEDQILDYLMRRQREELQHRVETSS